MANNLQEYILLLESLCPENIEQLYNYVTEDIVFSDPFNQLQGDRAYVELLKDMFEKLDDVQFTVHESSHHEKNHFIDNSTAYLYWTFTANSRTTGQLSFEGTSRLKFDENGKISSHQDFWDGLALLQEFPVLGTILRTIKKRISHQE